jgi:hypothetical protein
MHHAVLKELRGHGWRLALVITNAASVAAR